MFSREADIIVRYGGEEFLILLPETPPTGAKLLAERLLREISIGSEIKNIHITASIGISGVVDEISEVKEVILKADKALYKAKKEGRNRYIVLD